MTPDCREAAGRLRLELAAFMREIKLPKAINRKIGQAMHDFGMLEDGDSVTIAVSGGIDSLVTAWVLQMWRKKAPVEYRITAVHVDHSFRDSSLSGSPPAKGIQKQMDRFSIPFAVLDSWQSVDVETFNCYTCARSRRTQLFDFARRTGASKLAFGHHKDDLIETFFINILYSGNISTMLPRQDLFDGKLGIIRPLAYLEKNDVETLARLAQIRPVKNLCPLAGETRRDKLRVTLKSLYAEIPGAKESVFSALGNVKADYLLKKEK